MPAEVIRRREIDGRVEFDVLCDTSQYVVEVAAVHGVNHEVVGYRVKISNAVVLHLTEEAAMRAALRAIDRIRAPRPAAPVTPTTPAPPTELPAHPQ